MKGLWTKDIRLISSQQKNLAVIWLVAAGILIATDQISFAISYTSVITIMTAISTISYDTFDNGNAFLFTLPFSRKEYTREKYLFSLFWGMITVIGGILLVVIVTAAKGTLLMRSEEIVMAVLLNIPMLLIFQSMALPFLLKYEAEKGRIALAAMIGGIVFVVIFFFSRHHFFRIYFWNRIYNKRSSPCDNNTSYKCLINYFLHLFLLISNFKKIYHKL